MHHYRKTYKLYQARQRAASCPFCDPTTLDNKVADFVEAYIVPNLTKYDIWELHDVVEHLLLVPKRHVESLQELDDDEKLALIRIMSDYEAKGYNVYARASGSVRKSVAHQHTHLIKLKGKQAKGALFLSKPYMLIKR